MSGALPSGSRPGSLWRHRDFRRFWAGQAVSELGDRVTELALPLIAVDLLVASPTQAGVLTAVVWLPNLASLVIGAWVEQQRHKRALMIAADLFRAGVLLSLPAAYWLGTLSMVQLYGVALLAGTARVVFDTAYPSFFVRLVSREQYLEANSRLSTTRATSSVAGPAVAGVLIQALTAPVVVVLDAVSFVFSALQVRRVEVGDPVPDAAEQSLLRRAAAGVSYVARHPYLGPSLGCSSTMNFFAFMSTALLILFASRTLGLSPGVIGLAFGVGAGGGLIGALGAGRLARHLGVGPLIAAASVVYPGAVAVVALAGGPVWLRAGALAGAELLGSFAVMCFDIPHNSLRATLTPDRMRSRVAGAYSSVNYGIRPLGALTGGLLGSWIGVRETLLVSAVGGACAVVWLVRSPVIRVRELHALEPPPGR